MHLRDWTVILTKLLWIRKNLRFVFICPLPWFYFTPYFPVCLYFWHEIVFSGTKFSQKKCIWILCHSNSCFCTLVCAFAQWNSIIYCNIFDCYPKESINLGLQFQVFLFIWVCDRASFICENCCYHVSKKRLHQWDSAQTFKKIKSTAEMQCSQKILSM